MPWVIKIGGSLYGSRHLEKWLDTLDGYGASRLVIVPGGGPYADQVRATDRQFGLDPTLAHNMAVLAMQQFGCLMASLCPRLRLANCREQIQACWDNGEVAIWEPYDLVSRHCGLERTWDATSDSLAAWLAEYLSIEQLLFVKSAAVTLSEVSIGELQKHGSIDPVLPGLLAGTKIKAYFMHKSKAHEFANLIGAS